MFPPLKNPYLDEFESSMPVWRVPPHLRKLTMQRYVARQRMVAEYAWAIPTPEAIEVLLHHTPLVEMGAGTGYWAWLIRQAGGDIVAFDRYPPPDGRNRWHAGEKQWTEVKPGGPRLLARHPGRTLFLCWPPEDEPMAEQCIQAYAGSTLIYVGEVPGEGGAAALAEALQGWEPIETLDLPQWESVRDGLMVLRRKGIAVDQTVSWS
jgi:hypothetical protein